MRYPYVAGKLSEAARAAGGSDGTVCDRLYAAHLQLHTVLAEDFPPGPMRTAYEAIHDRLTKFRPDERHEESVIAVLRGMSDVEAGRLAQDICDLDRALTVFLIEGEG